MLFLISSFSYAQFNSKQDVYDYLEGKTFVYLDRFRASFHNAVINLEWEDVYKCKMNVYSFSANEAGLSGSFKVNSLYGVITYPMEMTLNRIKEEFKLTGSPMDGIYKLARLGKDVIHPEINFANKYDASSYFKNKWFVKGDKTLFVEENNDIYYMDKETVALVSSISLNQEIRDFRNFVIGAEYSIYGHVNNLDNEIGITLRFNAATGKLSFRCSYAKEIWKIDDNVGFDINLSDTYQMLESEDEIKKRVERKNSWMKAVQKERERRLAMEDERLRKQQELKRIQEEERIRKYNEDKEIAFATDPVYKVLGLLQDKEYIKSLFDYDIEVENPSYATETVGVHIYLRPSKKMESVCKDFWSKIDALPKNELTNLNRKPFIEEMMTNVYKNISNCIADFSILNKRSKFCSLKNIGEQTEKYGLQRWLTYKTRFSARGSVIMKTNFGNQRRCDIKIGNLNIGDIPFLQREYDGMDYLFHCELSFPYVRDYSYSLDANGKNIKAKEKRQQNGLYRQTRNGYRSIDMNNNQMHRRTR